MDPLFRFVLNVTQGHEEHDIEKFKQLITESDAEYSHVLYSYATALFLVVEDSHFDTAAIDLLLDAGFDINAQKRDEETPLLVALSKGLVEKSKHLIERGAKLTIVAKDGNLIHYAIKGNSIEMIEILLNKGVDVNYFGRTIDLPINLAVKLQQRETVVFLLEQKIQPVQLNSTDKKTFPDPPLCCVVRCWQQPQNIQLFLDAGADVNSHGDQKLTPLSIALALRKRPVVDLLLERGARWMDLGDYDELYFACRQRHANALRVLIERGAAVTKVYPYKATLVHVALKSYSLPKELESYLNSAMTVGVGLGLGNNNLQNLQNFNNQLQNLQNQFQNLQQMFANNNLDINLPDPNNINPNNNNNNNNNADGGNNNNVVQAIIDVLQQLHDASAMFNEGDEFGYSPMMYAKTLQEFQALENFGADPTLRLNGNSLLHRLLENNLSYEIIEYILNMNLFDVNERAQKGNTPLHIIASIEQNDYWHPNNSSYASFAELLLQHGADVNLTDIEHGKTPLMIAVKSENLSVIRALARVPATNLAIEDLSGDNVLHILGRTKCHPELILKTIVAPEYVHPKVIRDLQRKCNIDGETPIEVAKKSGNEGIAMLLEGDIFGAAKAGISVFEYVKLHPSTMLALKRGYEFRPADISRYNFNTGQESLFFRLAQETISAILLENNLEGLIAFSLVCKQFKKWTEHAVIWREFFKRIYGRESRAKNVKKEIVLKRAQELNMTKGNFVMNTVQLKPNDDKPDAYYTPASKIGVTCMDFSPEHELLVVGTYSGNVVFINVKTYAVVKIIPVNEQVPVLTRAINRVVLCPAEKSIIYNRKDGALFVHNYETDDQVELSKQNMLDFKVNGDFIFFTETNNYIWANWITNERLWTFNETGEPAALSLTDDVAITVTNGEKCVRFWNLNTFTPISQSDGVSRPGKIWLSKNYIILTCAHGFECFDGHTYQLRYSQHCHTSSGVSNLIFDEENDRLISVACAELFVSKLSTGEIILRLSEQDYKASPVQWERGAWQYMCVAVKGDFVFAGLQGNRCCIEVYDVTKPPKSPPVFTIPLKTSPKSLIIKENYLIIGLINETVKIVSFNIASNFTTTSSSVDMMLIDESTS
jgi:ankyrin repeat protein